MRNKELLILILAGAVLRILTAYFAYGFIAFDEYFMGMDPAGYKLLIDSSYKFTDAVRTPLLFYFDHYLFLFANKVLGVSSPLGLVRFASIVLGLISVLGIWMSYKIAENLGESKRTALLCAALSSFYFVMPFINTRLMVESISGILLVSAFYFWSRRSWFWFAFLIGVSSMFRFQNGVVFIFMLLYMLFAARMAIPKFLLGGLAALFLQAVIDHSVFGGFLTSLITYTKFQMDTLMDHSRQPWYNFILLFIALSIPIASIVILPALYKAGVKYKMLGIAFLGFILAHSFSPHKEDRFMIPMIPLYLVLIGLGLEPVRSYFEEKGYKKLYKFSIYWFWIFNFILLVPVTISPTMSNVIDAMEYSRKNDAVVFISDSPMITRLFIAYKEIRPVQKDKWRDELCSIGHEGPKGYEGYYIHSIFPPEETKITEHAKACGVKLSYVRNFKGGHLDRLFAYLNPKFNYRRANGHLYRLVP